MNARLVVRAALMFALCYFGIGVARADDLHPTAPEAYAHCISGAQALLAASYSTYTTRNRVATCTEVNVGFREHWTLQWYNSGGDTWYGASGDGQIHNYDAQCSDSAHTYDSATHSCSMNCPGTAEDPDHPGTCMDVNKCLARGDAMGHRDGGDQRPWKDACIAGCQYRMEGATKHQIASADPFYQGTIAITGICGVPTPMDPSAKPNEAHPDEVDPPKETCVAAGNGMTECVKPNGQHCSTATANREICWNPNETGEKTDGNVLQKSCNGTSCPDLPDSPPPPNDSFNKGDSITDSTTTNNSTTTTTTTNYSTTTGSPAGDGNQGQPGGTKDGNAGGKDEDDKGTASGGQDCDTPLTTSGGDPLTAAAAQQVYLSRCGKSLADKNGNGQPDWTELKPEDDADPASGETPQDLQAISEGGTVDGSGLDGSGFVDGAGTCPSLAGAMSAGWASSAFAEWLASPPPEFCNFIGVLRAIIILLASITAVYIVAGKKE